MANRTSGSTSRDGKLSVLSWSPEAACGDRFGDDAKTAPSPDSTRRHPVHVGSSSAWFPRQPSNADHLDGINSFGTRFKVQEETQMRSSSMRAPAKFRGTSPQAP